MGRIPWAKGGGQPPSGAAADRPLQLFARGKSAKESYWSISRTTGRVAGGTGTDMLAGDVISFSEEDDKDTDGTAKDSAKTLSRRLMADMGTDIVSVNEAKREGWFYATPVSRVKMAPVGARIYSGRQILRTMLREAKVSPQAPFVVGAAFSGDPTTAVVLFVCDDGGRLRDMQYVPVAGEDLTATVRNFVQGARLAASGSFPEDRILVFDSEQLVKRMPLFKAYPAEPELMGWPVSQWDRVALVASGAVFAGTALFGAWQWWAAASAAKSTAQLRQETSQAQLRIKLALNERLDGLLRTGSVPVDRAIDVAARVYRDGTRVELQTDRKQIAAKVVAKLDDPANGSEAISRLLSAPVPAGCGRRPLEINKTLSEVYLTYECPSTDPLAADLLGGSR